MCGCTKRVKAQYIWTNGTESVTYDSEIAAKAKVIRSGGSYTKKDS